jgi:single-strand DNA-binding protein
MAKGINKMIAVGNLGKDPEVHNTANGGTVTTISVGCTEKWNDRQSGNQQERTEWVRCVAFGKLAEIIAQYAKKGQQVYCEGKLNTRKWQDQSGQDRYTTEVILSQFLLLGGQRGARDSSPQYGGQQRQQPPQQQPQGQQQPQQGGLDDFDDDLPF